VNRILVVDDEADILELVGFNLREAGYCVFTADTGPQALKKARDFLPDLIVLDLMLPELDGFAVCEILKRLPSTASIPVLMLTSWASEDARVIGLQVGATDYMVKPFSPRELVARVGAILRRTAEPVAYDKD
jgi:two-component system phosphate regulon response regulator PhoB